MLVAGCIYYHFVDINSLMQLATNAKLGARRGACGAMALSDRYQQFGVLAFAIAQIAECVRLPGDSRDF